MDKKPILLFKYGGNAMLNEELKEAVLASICKLSDTGYGVVIVHGGGPFIKKALKDADIASDFVDGHRVTPPEAYEHVETALKGKVNGNLVSIINRLGYSAVGLSGKDGKTVLASKRLHTRTHKSGKKEEIDLGRVGDVHSVNPDLLHTLLAKKYIPVITCVASDKDGIDYNINGDMFAGHIAGALKAKSYIVLTDVDGLLRDKERPESLINHLKVDEIDRLVKSGVIVSGMIPKTESCMIAIREGAEAARIINGTKPEQILQLQEDKKTGTLISK